MPGDASIQDDLTGGGFPVRGVYWALGCFVVALAASIRLPILGFKPFMHDESLFAYYSHYLWKNGAMEYDPLLHGPFLLQANAVVFALFGDSDFTARLFCALCGIGLCVVVLATRPMRDRLANWLAALFIAVSPSLCYYSRFCRNDMPFALFTILWIGGCAQYWRTRRVGWGALAVLSFFGMACVKENVVFLMATSLAFLLLLILADLAGQWQRGHEPVASRSRLCDVRTFLLVNNIILVSLLGGGLALYIRASMRLQSPVLFYVCLLCVSVAVSLVVATMIDAGRSGAGVEGLARRIAQRLWRDRFALGAAAALGVVFFVLVYNFWQIGCFSPIGGFRQWLSQIGSHGPPAQWFKSSLAASSAGSLGPLEILDKAVSYWWGQHAEHRLKGPFHYYVPLLVVYEWPLLLIVFAGGIRRLLATPMLSSVGVTAIIVGAVVGVAAGMALDAETLDGQLHAQSVGHLAVAGALSGGVLVLVVADLFTRQRARAFLVFWLFSTVLAISYAGEKIPWLTVHVALPLAMLAGAEVASFVRWVQTWVSLGRSAMWRWQLLGALAGVVLLASIKWSLDTGRLLANGFDPRERLVYNHTSLETKVAAKRVIAASQRAKALGEEFPVGMRGEAAWPMYWYLRDLDLRPLEDAGPLAFSVVDALVIDPSDLHRAVDIDRSFHITEEPLRVAWVPPSVSLGRVFMRGADEAEWGIGDPREPGVEACWLWNYWLRREVFPVDEDCLDPVGATTFILGWRRPGTLAVDRVNDLGTIDLSGDTLYPDM